MITQQVATPEQRLEAILDAYRLYAGLDAEDGLEPVDLLNTLERINRLDDPTGATKLRVLPEDRRS